MIKIERVEIHSGYGKTVHIYLTDAYVIREADVNDLPQDFYEKLVKWLEGREKK